MKIIKTHWRLLAESAFLLLLAYAHPPAHTRAQEAAAGTLKFFAWVCALLVAAYLLSFRRKGRGEP